MSRIARARSTARGVAAAAAVAALLVLPVLPALAQEGHGHPPKPPAGGQEEAERPEGAPADPHPKGGGAHHGYKAMDKRALAVQVLGFAILAYIIGRYAVPPLARILEERRLKIKDAFEGFDARDRDLADAKANAEYGQREVERNAAARLDQAAREGAELRDQLVVEGDQYAGRVKERLGREKELERQFYLLLLRNRMVEFSLRAAEQTLRAGVDRATHDAIVDKFLDDIDATVKVKA